MNRHILPMIALMAACPLPSSGGVSIDDFSAHVPRGPAPPILTRSGYVTNPLELHKLARKNKRRGRR